MSDSKISSNSSTIRQVPDNQEVYLDSNGYSSIVVEILEYVEKSNDEEALQYHFGDLVEDTGDQTTIISQDRAAMKSLPYVVPNIFTKGTKAKAQ